MDHDNPLCASLGHYIGQVVVVYCPHRQGWAMYIRSGDDADDIADEATTLQFGPFDTDEDVAIEARGQITKMVRTRKAVFVQRRRDQ